MNDTELRAHYLAYLAALNERRFDDLVDFVRDELTYNDQPLARSDYQRDREADARAIPDLRYDPDVLVVQGDQVGCRLVFDCTPRTDFFGLPTAGRRVVFAEHVFYRFEDGRIAQVRSLIDRAAVADQVR